MTQEVKLRRVQCNYRPENARFLLECDFSKQYCNYYRMRLEKTRPYLEYNARIKWDPSISIYNLSEVAIFSSDDPLDDSDLGVSPPRLTPPRNVTDDKSDDFGTPGSGGYYRFPKRIRKISESSVTNHPVTSTQIDPQAETSGQDILTSPITSRTEISETPNVRRAKDTHSAECIVIGTIFKRMRLQPDVVAELSRGDFHVKCERYLGHYTSQDDTLVLEDAEESISLVGNIDPKHFVTGICVALLGYSIGDGSQFLVRDICYAEPNRSLLYDDIQLSPSNDSGASSNIVDVEDGPIYLMIVSGLGFHHEMEKKTALTQALQNMIDFVWGGAKYSDDRRSHRVARILVLGNNLHEERITFGYDDEENEAGFDPDDIAARMRRSRQVKEYSKSITAIKHMDDFFAQLSKTIDVDVMPGPSDPSSHLMPQQPFHPCMFPKSCKFSTFNCTTNPHHAIYNKSVELLATAGQNIDIINKFSGLRDPIDIMKHHLKWGNSAPSAPDNLYSVPYEDEDPYVIDFIPDIYIAGCQEEYRTDYHYYKSSEPSQVATSQNTSFASSVSDSTMINVTPESLRSRQAQSSRYQADSPVDPNPSQDIISTPKLASSRQTAFAIECSSDNSNDSSGERTPSDYVPNQLALLKRSQFAQPTPKKVRTLLISVPKFHKSLSCVLIDLKNMEPEILSFKQ